MTRRGAVAVLAALVVALLGVPAVAAPLTTHKLKAVLRVSAITVHAGTLVTFDASRSTAPPHVKLTSWRIAFGDGTKVATGKGKPPKRLTHVFTKPAITNVRLTVTDSTHHSNAALLQVQVLKAVATSATNPPFVFPTTTPVATTTPHPTTPAGSPTPTPNPAAPISGFAAHPNGQSIALSWTGSSGASTIDIRRRAGTTSPDASTPGDLIGTVPGGTTFFSDISVNVGDVFSYALFIPSTASAFGTRAATTTASAVTASPGPVHLCGLIRNDVTWSPQNAAGYVLECPVVIASYATLTVKPGTWVKGGYGGAQCSYYAPSYLCTSSGRLDVDGNLDAEGTAADPVTFTSIDDDSVGGDTSGDGAVAPYEGQWWGIVSDEYAGADGYAPTFHMDHVEVKYATAGASVGGAAFVNITNSSFVHDGGALQMYPYEGDRVTLTGNTVTNSDLGIQVRVFADDTSTSPTVTGNTVNDTAGPAIVIEGMHLLPSKLTGNTGSNDQPTSLSLTGNLAEDATLPSSGLPWTIGTWCPFGYKTSGSSYAIRVPDGACGLTIQTGVTLTLNAGAVIKGSAGGYLAVEGSLIAAGTPAQPVTLTSVNDDSVGGNTNGVATAPEAGDWLGIVSGHLSNTPIPVVSLDHVAVHYAGLPGLNDSHVSITSSTVSDATTTGIVVNGGDATVTGNTVLRSHFDGIDVGVPSSPVVTGNVVSSSGGAALKVLGPAIDPSTVSGNVGSANHEQGIVLAGTLTADGTAPTAGLPWIAGSSDACGYGSAYTLPFAGCIFGLAVAPGATLTVGPGAVLKAESLSELSVAGTLAVQGTALAPAIITAIADDSVGGDTNGDGDGTAPAANPWEGIMAIPQSGSPRPKVIIDHATLSYGRFPVVAYGLVDVTIASSTIAHAEQDAVQVGLAYGAHVSITGNTVTGGKRGIVVSTAPNETTSPVIEDNVLIGVGATIVLFSNAIDPQALTGNTGAGDGISAIQVNGTLVGNLTLPVAGLPWAIGAVSNGSATCTPCSLTVGLDATLTLGPGGVLKAAAHTTLLVAGHLVGAGSALQPAAITALEDDVNGGDTNGDGDGSVPVPGEWSGIAAVPGGAVAPTIQLDRTTVGYAATALSTTYAASLTHSRLIGDQIGVVGPTPGDGGVCGTQVDATNTYWGDPTGPAPTGKGASVSGCVAYQPFAAS